MQESLISFQLVTLIFVAVWYLKILNTWPLYISRVISKTEFILNNGSKMTVSVASPELKKGMQIRVLTTTEDLSPYRMIVNFDKGDTIWKHNGYTLH